MAEKKNDVSKLKFEEAVDALTEIVRGIEGGEIELETSLQQYERGMGLIKHCRGILEKAEKRIEKISADNKKEETEEDADGEGSGELF
jgi:exodeoxyribonuclease VII small subunit